MKRAGIIVLLIAAAAAAGCAAGKPNEKLCAPDLASESSATKKIAVMPADLKIAWSGVKGEEELFQMSDDVSKLAEKAAADALAGYGFKIVDNGLSKQVLDEDPEIKTDLQSLLQQCRNIDIQTEPDITKMGGYRVTDTRIEKGELKIGYDVAPFAADAGADALLFIQGRGIVHSAGKQVLGAVVNIAYYDILLYRAFLVNGRDGTVLMAFYGSAPLDQFVPKEAMPGNEKYKPGLEKLRMALRGDFNKKIGNTLGRMPSVK